MSAQLELTLDAAATLRALYDDGTYPDGFFDWVIDNWHVYDAVVTIARRAKERGYHRWSVWAAIQIIRWETGVRESHSPLKVNNNATGGLARLIMAREPDLAGFFETRQPAASRREAYRLDGSQYGGAAA